MRRLRRHPAMSRERL
ncbi:TPA: hypothetical protein SML19_002844 [Klebsiella oxytoca]|nr:hypothetical protein [Klebsiella oxytoca]HEJ6673171.1 hypothetical protein [Klebsiella oxytoca]HEJ8282842.1 hypothetical protein [Klebsiella oxytoca]HEJ8976291.1 hypothetical protein [Klebsiella oxytoca]